MSSLDTAYYQDRLEAETALALTAQSEKSAAGHADLARHYQFMIDHSAPRPKLKIATLD